MTKIKLSKPVPAFTEPTSKSQTINVTPTWEAILPLLLAVYTDGNFTGRKESEAELRRMAQLADRYVAEHKGEKS